MGRKVPPGIFPWESASGTRYKVKVFVGRINCKPKYAIKTFGTLDEAITWQSQQKIQKAQGTTVLPSKVTLKDYTQQTLTKIRDTLKPTSYESYEMWSRVHIIPQLGDLPLSALTTQRIEAALLKCLNDGLRGSSTKHVFTVLNIILKRAVKLGDLPKNPCDNVDRRFVRRDDFTPKIFDKEQMSLFFCKS